jgi:hypothetical protein
VLFSGPSIFSERFPVAACRGLGSMTNTLLACLELLREHRISIDCGKWLTLETDADHSGTSHPQVAPRGVLCQPLLREYRVGMNSCYLWEAGRVGDVRNSYMSC